MATRTLGQIAPAALISNGGTMLSPADVEFLKSFVSFLEAKYDGSGNVTGFSIDDSATTYDIETPRYATIAALEAARPAASNTYQVAIITGIHDTGTSGGMYVRSNGTYYVPMFSPVYTQAAGMSAFPAATYPGVKMRFSDVGVGGGAVHVSDGTNYVPDGGRCLLAQTATEVKFTAPVSGANGVVSSIVNNGGFVQLVFAGAHGLTTSPAAGCNLVVKTAGNGWTLGQRANITTVDDTTKITTNVAYASVSGEPTIARVGEEFIMESLTIPVLHGKSGFEFRGTFYCNPQAGTKSLLIRLNSTTTNNIISTGLISFGANVSVGLHNANNTTTAQTGNASSGVIGPGVIATPGPVSLAVDTSAATTLYLMSNFQSAANEIMAIESYELYKVG